MARELAERQVAIDEKKTERLPFLHRRKAARMVLSPLAFLRGAAPLFYELMRDNPDLKEGPPGEGWLVGDAHVENFGAYRAEAQEKADAVVYDLNDFDDAFVGPWHVDVVRVVTSLVLAGRELGADGRQSVGLARLFLDGYVDGHFSGRKLPEAPRPVATLIAQVKDRSARELLDARTRPHGNRRRFVRGPRYVDLPPEINESVESAFSRYLRGLPKAECPREDHTEIWDAAQRIAGTGSLGVVRIAVLVNGKGGRDGGWIFDMKEQGEPSASVVFDVPEDLKPAERVETAFRKCVARPPRLVGTTKMNGLSMFVRKLTPQEDKLDLSHVRGQDLGPLATYGGILLGRGHARGATKPPKKPWTDADKNELLDRAMVVAGAHEAGYLALCDTMRQRGLLPT
jgi:uncharacterized protein (DUF2252 family)